MMISRPASGIGVLSHLRQSWPTMAVVGQHRGAPIVLMEDDRNDAYFFRHALEKADIVNPVVCFQTGGDARAHFREGQRFDFPALFVVDVSLAGGETGIDFLRW